MLLSNEISIRNINNILCFHNLFYLYKHFPSTLDDCLYNNGVVYYCITLYELIYNVDIFIKTYFDESVRLHQGGDNVRSLQFVFRVGQHYTVMISSVFFMVLFYIVSVC